jgi:uncharacterized Rmd1/YagE family protein
MHQKEKTLGTPNTSAKSAKIVKMPKPKNRNSKKRKSKNQRDIEKQLKEIARSLPVVPMPVLSEGDFEGMEVNEFEKYAGDVKGMEDKKDNVIPVPKMEIAYMTFDVYYFDLQELFKHAKSEDEGIKAIEDYVKNIHERDKECQKMYPHLYETKKTAAFEEIKGEKVN